MCDVLIGGRVEKWDETEVWNGPVTCIDKSLRDLVDNCIPSELGLFPDSCLFNFGLLKRN
jgi:hypothetical protein